jgi:hypothetical protein
VVLVNYYRIFEQSQLYAKRRGDDGRRGRDPAKDDFGDATAESASVMPIVY